jgi:choline dehydrogenase
MHRTLLHTLAATPTLAWTQPRFGYIPGNNYGVPQNASYDYVVGGGNVGFTCLRVVTLF